MTDPELSYARVVAGDPTALGVVVDALADARKSLNLVHSDLVGAAVVPGWTGGASVAYRARSANLVHGIELHRAGLDLIRGAIETAGTAHGNAVEQADFYIGFWRHRPPGLHPVIDELLARQVNARLLGVGRHYDQQLRAINAALTGGQLDLDELDDDTREWVEKGLAKTDAWEDETGGGLGPLIPNTLATGDDRGWIPQGMAYDDATGTYLQAYYTKASGDDSTMAVIDEASGEELTEVNLGGDLTADGITREVDRPQHVGGVAVSGDSVYITDSGKVYEYSLKEMRNAAPGATVNPTAEPQPVAASSYSTIRNGVLYVGSHYDNMMYRYAKDSSGRWQPLDIDQEGQPRGIATPDRVQGVLVRDGEYVFSTSYGRINESNLVVQDRWTGERGEPYPLPNMAQSVVEVDGNLVVTYESGAAEYSTTPGIGWLWGVPDDGSLWASPYMTTTPLEELGLGEETGYDPWMIGYYADGLDGSSTAVATTATTLDGLSLPDGALGTVPAAGTLRTTVHTLLDSAATSLALGAQAVTLASDGMRASLADTQHTDAHVTGALRRILPF